MNDSQKGNLRTSYAGINEAGAYTEILRTSKDHPMKSLVE